MTLLTASLIADDLATVRAQAPRAWTGGADAVELRLDGYQGDPAALAEYLRGFPNQSWILTRRSIHEGGQCTESPHDRARFLLVASMGTRACLDFEFADRAELLEQLKSGPHEPAGEGVRERIILSWHDCDSPLTSRLQGHSDAVRHQLSPGDSLGEKSVPRRLERHSWSPRRQVDTILSALPTAVAKVAYPAKEATDSFAALDLMHEHGGRCVAVGMGETGLWTRVLAKKMGAFSTYCALDANSATAPGQLSLADMTYRYRWSALNAETRIFGLLGDPVGHSLSPTLFNYWFDTHGINAVYLPIRVLPLNHGLSRFLNECLQRPWLSLGGFSVTHPHKTEALVCVGEDRDRTTESIGALNTIVVRGSATGPRLQGFNTDCHAAIASLAHALRRERSQLRGLTVDVLGTGGSARAVLSGLRDYGCAVTVFGRSEDKARRLADRFQCRHEPWMRRAERRGEVLINCTNVGMAPPFEDSPMPSHALVDRRLVFDLIYYPRETSLLRAARQAGIATLGGLDMFLRQAAVQFELWTGRSVDPDTGRQVIETELQSRQTPGAADRQDDTDRNRARAPSAQVPVRLNHPMMALIGLRGCGKSTIGRLLAERLNRPWVDTDDLIEQAAGSSIAAIFAREGEGGFRRREELAVAEAVLQWGAIISVGGGAPLNPHNVEALHRAGTIIWLKAAPEVLWSRISTDPKSATRRPPLSNHSGLEELVHLAAIRDPIYQSVADLIVDATEPNPSIVVEKLLSQVSVSKPH